LFLDLVQAREIPVFNPNLVTLDNQQLQRLSPLLRTACPVDLLRELATG